ncbi:MAG: hypothetical protein FWE95_08440 [Planctomycetaceae bacterium]|nr:hypothetical protein [Planctomycetaceae bacterium]
MNALFSRLGLLAVLLALLLPANVSGQIWVKALGDPNPSLAYAQGGVTQAAEYDWVRIFGYPSNASFDFTVEGQWNPGAQRSYMYEWHCTRFSCAYPD